MDSLKLNVGSAFLANPSLSARASFAPEDTHLGDYVFVPWVRTGLSAAIREMPKGLRTVIEARVEIADSHDGSGAMPASRNLTLYGPGDVMGIDPAQIIRREPAPDTLTAEEGYLAHIEFARPDLPWLFSPEPAAGDSCPVWLALVVVEAAMSHLEPSQDERSSRLWTKKGQLQSLATNARFCHAQVVGAALDGDGPKLRGPQADSVETRLSDDHAPANLSRILCPRRLAPATRYIAALVPAYDCGVRSGLGLGGGSLAPAWVRQGGDEADDIVLPVYDSWRFATAGGGAFPVLAARIRPISAPWRIGRRSIDLSQPGANIAALPDGAPEGIQSMKCALYSPATDGPADAPAYPIPLREAIRARVDQANLPDADLPRVGARLYARYQRAASSLGPVFGAPLHDADADGDWFAQLNTDPLHRIVAGLGARVVQKDQEPLMQSAWAQVDGIRRANQALAWAGLAEVVNISIMGRHIQPLDLGRMMQVTRNVQIRLRDGGQPRTIGAAIQFSRTAEATMSAAFRRATRPNGPVARRAQMTAPGLAVANQARFQDHRRDIATLDGVGALSDLGRSFFSPAVIAKVMDVPLRGASDSLARRLRHLGQSGTAASQLSQEKWEGPAIDRPGDALGAGLLSEIGKLDAGAIRASGLAEIMVGLMNSGGDLGARARVGLTRLSARAPAQDLDRKRMPFGGAAVVTPDSPVKPNVTLPGLGANFPGSAAIRGNLARGSLNLPGRRDLPLIIDKPPPHGPGGLGGQGGQGGSGGGRDQARAAPPEKRFESEVSRRISDVIAGLNKTSISALRQQMAVIITGINLPPKASLDLGELNLSRSLVLAQIEPRASARAAFKGRILRLPDCINPDWIDSFGLRPIMAAPVFQRAMYEALDDYDRNWLVPGLGAIAERDFITVLSINPSFAEAFLIGASDEMGRELLWRDYPTDQRGTYFKRFWDSRADELTRSIHEFARQPLGRHFKIGGDKPAGAGAGALALVVRGDLLRRFPDTVIAAMRATSADGPPTFIAGSEAEILFHAHLDPDYTVVGFDLTKEQVLGGQNWWFVFAQNPTAPRFGAASNPIGAPVPKHGAAKQGELDWADFGNVPAGGFLDLSGSFSVTDSDSQPALVNWPGHAGVVARVLLTDPYRAAFRADRLIAKTQAQP
ncbi:hypothetical protein [Paracoccus sp. (in: a-proteobacteria)]|uniref:hypothetical protein n=1 Tax=Paracoccus sp. TaxID=267 RepID=UPI002899EE04|nr:hypothetical protein [Paracoccus sp. (in: a-proteobacteria)]